MAASGSYNMSLNTGHGLSPLTGGIQVMVRVPCASPKPDIQGDQKSSRTQESGKDDAHPIHGGAMSQEGTGSQSRTFEEGRTEMGEELRPPSAFITDVTAFGLHTPLSQMRPRRPGMLSDHLPHGEPPR